MQHRNTDKFSHCWLSIGIYLKLGKDDDEIFSLILKPKKVLETKTIIPATYSYSQSKLVYNLVAQLRCGTDQACLRHEADHAAVTAARACSAVWCLATVASHGPYPAAPGRCRSAPAQHEIKWWPRSTRILNCMRKNYRCNRDSGHILLRYNILERDTGPYTTVKKETRNDASQYDQTTC